MNSEIAVFNAIIIDTNAFDAKGNDFGGYFDPILPSFLSLFISTNCNLFHIPFFKEKLFDT